MKRGVQALRWLFCGQRPHFLALGQWPSAASGIAPALLGSSLPHVGTWRFPSSGSGQCRQPGGGLCFPSCSDWQFSDLLIRFFPPHLMKRQGFRAASVVLASCFGLDSMEPKCVLAHSMLCSSCQGTFDTGAQEHTERLMLHVG